MTCAQPRGPQGSFLEPPNFGNYSTPDHRSSHRSEDSSSDGSGELDQRNTRSNSGWRSPHALLKTLYTDNDFDIEQGPSFKFTDVPQVHDDEGQDQGNDHGAADMYGSTPASLTVRIIPRSSDPI